jgi:hypothetical protein
MNPASRPIQVPSDTSDQAAYLSYSSNIAPQAPQGMFTQAVVIQGVGKINS